jgi:hypothetical protein
MIERFNNYYNSGSIYGDTINDNPERMMEVLKLA